MTKFKLNRFWNVTSKWYFFPALYIILTFLVFLYLKGYNDVKSPIEIFLYMIFLIPNGIIYFNYLLTGKKSTVIVGAFLPYFYFALMALIIVIIQYFKIRKKIILKWIILVMFIVIFLTFFGCAAGNWEKTTY